MAMSNDKHYVPSEEDWVPTEEEVRHFSRAWLTKSDFDRFLAKVKRDAFEKGIATGYMRGYHDSEVGLLYSPPIPPTTSEETR